MPETEVTDRCPHCDHAHSVLSGQPGVTLFGEYEVDRLKALFNGGLDDFVCEACKRSTGHRLTTVFIAEYPLACYLVEGTFSQPYLDSVIENTRASCRKMSPNLEPQILPSMDDLRDVVQAQLCSNIDYLNKVMNEPSDDSCMTALAQVDARHFAAVRIALDVPEAGINIRLNPPREVDVFIDQLTHCQAGSWIALWHYRRQACNSATNLDAQLALRLYEPIMLPGAADYALTVLTAIEQRELSMSFPTEYCLHALRASICALAERNNPDSADWAMLFFKAEMALRLGNDESQAIVKPLIISEERARNTISYQDAGDAVAKIVTGEVQPQETFDALNEIAAKVGYPQLLTDFAATIHL